MCEDHTTRDLLAILTSANLKPSVHLGLMGLYVPRKHTRKATTSGLEATTRRSDSKEINRIYSPTTLLKYNFSKDHKIPATEGLVLTCSPLLFLPLIVTNTLLLI